MATARAPPPCRSFVGSFQASEKTPNFTALSNWLPHPAQPPFTLDRFLNPPWGVMATSQCGLDKGPNPAKIFLNFVFAFFENVGRTVVVRFLFRIETVGF
jgi:hypothetical protein